MTIPILEDTTEYVGCFQKTALDTLSELGFLAGVIGVVTGIYLTVINKTYLPPIEKAVPMNGMELINIGLPVVVISSYLKSSNKEACYPKKRT